MKKSRIAKLALSGAAVAALAATFSTSTYAWYVSNKTANVTAVTGSTASGDSDKSISLSLDGTKGTFKKTITLTNANKTGTGLVPLSRYSGGAAPVYKELAEDGNTMKATATYSGTGYYTYTFYILAQETCTIVPHLVIENTTSEYPTQINYATGSVGGVAAGDTFYVDARDSMSVSQYVTRGGWITSGENVNKFTSTPTNNNTYYGVQLASGTNLTGWYTDTACQNAASGTADGETTYYKQAPLTSDSAGDVDSANIAKGVSNTPATPTGASLVSGGAQTYYNTIVGKTLTADADNTTGDAVNKFTTSNSLSDIASITLLGGEPYQIVYHLWLDGADDQCFNCAANQQIEVTFDYTVSA